MIQLGCCKRMQQEGFLGYSEALTVCMGAGRIALLLGRESTRSILVSAVSFLRRWQTMSFGFSMYFLVWQEQTMIST
jgi:hypothetical protein